MQKKRITSSMKRNWILGIILFLLVICIIYLWNTNEGFDVAAVEVCPNPSFIRNSEGVCVAPPLAHDDGKCDDPSLIPNDHGYCVAHVAPANAQLRIDNSCPDPNQSSVYDRFTQGVWADMSQPMNQGATSNICKYEQQSAPTGIIYSNYTYKGNPNVCLPDCPSNFIPSPNDFTLCIAQACYNTEDLSSNIIASWRQNCGPMYKTQLDFTSTLRSVSTVTASINNQFAIASNNMNYLSNGAYSVNVIDASNKLFRDSDFPNILLNYNTLQNLTNLTNTKYNNLLSSKSNFDANYYAFKCDLYTQN